ncbi:uncharacterized protein insc [Chelonus insularis]|uniref:uncharacterized protein insc n=1 Tax=Chelonus insularis TaxID=460826 RepID=UPI00158D894A|nr:uncharacterized protein LOC118070244 [Chelonus insularis]
MAGFKRMQSKVFWGQMAAQDIEHIPLICRNTNSVDSRLIQSAYCNFGRESDTDVEKHSDSSSSGADMQSEVDANCNITAVKLQITYGNDNNLDDHTKVQVDDTVEECNELENNNDTKKFPRDVEDVGDNLEVDESPEEHEQDIEEYQDSVPSLGLQFFNPDQEHGSLDSGFSDSETSKCGGNVDNAMRKRKKRRKKSRDYTRVHGRLSFLWNSHEIPPNPAHTSTPKLTRDCQVFQSRQNAQHEGDCDKNIEGETLKINRVEDNQGLIPDSYHDQLQIEEDKLESYLYTTEPPEDEIPTTPFQSTSEGSTPSVAGHWYTRMSNESSLETNSKLNEKNYRANLEKSYQASVKAWLADIEKDVDYECVITLQSKTLPRRSRMINQSEEAQNRDLRMLTASATAAATQLIIRAEGFNRHLQEVVEKISSLENSRSERELLRGIEEEAFSILSELGAPPPRRIHDGSLKSILSQLRSLNDVVDSALDTRLDFYIERVVRGLEDAPRETGSAARGALAALTALGLAGARAGNSIARCSGVRALLTSLISASRLSSELRAASLRALSSVCCCALSISHFVKEGGPEILVELLTSPTTPEREKIEATALVVQITAPWTEARGLKYLEPFANLLVDTLTHLAESTTCSQTLLLSAAALNNLAESTKCIQAIVRFETVRKLLRCVKKAPGGNIWLMEQVASLIGKLAKFPKIRKHLAQARASVALICFLRMAPPGLEDAYERLSTTSATALTRLCVEPEIARQVVAIGGADCLPNYENNNRDNPDDRFGQFQYTKSLRIACRKAAQQIGEAKACDYSIE